VSEVVSPSRIVISHALRAWPRAPSLNLDAVSSSKVCKFLGDQQAVLDFYWAIDDLEPNLVPSREEPLRERPDLAASSIDACIESEAPGPVQHGVGRPVLQHPVDVTAVVRVEPALESVDVPEPWRGNVTASVELIDDLERQIDAVNRKLRESHADHPYIPLLMSVPGIRWVLAFTIGRDRALLLTRQAHRLHRPLPARQPVGGRE
jgi:hypothetical protein